MAKDEATDKDKGGGAGKWFLKKLATTPAAWLGLVVGIAVANPFADASGSLAGVIVGTIAGVGVGLLAWLISSGIQTSYRNAKASAAILDRKNATELEQLALKNLRESNQTADADLLEKIFRDRDAIVDRCCSQQDNADAAHTLELVAAIVGQVCVQSEELQDLVRRTEDPLLESPAGAEKKISELRSAMARAYQAVADTRSRFRRGEKIDKIDFLADSESLAEQDLSALATRLEEETELSRRVEKRLQSNYEPPPDYGDPIESTGEDQRESD